MTDDEKLSVSCMANFVGNVALKPAKEKHAKFDDTVKEYDAHSCAESNMRRWMMHRQESQQSRRWHCLGQLLFCPIRNNQPPTETLSWVHAADVVPRHGTIPGSCPPESADEAASTRRRAELFGAAHSSIPKAATSRSGCSDAGSLKSCEPPSREKLRRDRWRTWKHLRIQTLIWLIAHDTGLHAARWWSGTHDHCFAESRDHTQKDR